MQREVSKLMMKHTLGHLQLAVRGRISTIVRAVVKIQKLFRKVALSKKSRDSEKKEEDAAVKIQRAFRSFLTKTRERRRRLSANLHPTTSSLPSRRPSYGILRSASEDEALSPEAPNRAPAQDFITFIPTEDGELKRIVVRRGVGRVLPPDPSVSLA